jgi:hypothetical protein
MREALRIIDANLNRSREGLRVCEDITRFILNDRPLTASFKSARHAITALAKGLDGESIRLLKSRNVKKDVGKKTSRRESMRGDIPNIFFANLQRAKESLRVLEEITKLLSKKKSQAFKKMRFRVYELEKKSRLRLEVILHSR